jgi:carbonic anhydrase
MHTGAMKNLIAGYHRFRDATWPERRRLFETLAARGQSPRAAVLACIDSRVDPVMIFDAAPGEILTIRNVANLVPPYEPDDNSHGTSAALEFAVRGMKVSDLIVLGHGQCGGVAALLADDPRTLGSFIGPWMRQAQRARRRALECAPADRQLEAEYETVRVSLDNLMTFPWVAEGVAAGALRLHGAHFAVHTGVLALMGADGRFAPADQRRL